MSATKTPPAGFTARDFVNSINPQLYVSAARAYPGGPKAYVLRIIADAREAEHAGAKDVYLSAVEAAVAALLTDVREEQTVADFDDDNDEWGRLPARDPDRERFNPGR